MEKSFQTKKTGEEKMGNWEKLLFALLLAAFWLPLVNVENTADYGYLFEVSQTTFLPSTIHSGDIVSLAVDVHNRSTGFDAADLNAMLDIGNQFEGIKLNDTVSIINAQSTKTILFQFRVKPDTIAGYYP